MGRQQVACSEQMKAGGSAQLLRLASVDAKCLHRVRVTGEVHGGEIHPGLVSMKTTYLPKEFAALER